MLELITASFTAPLYQARNSRLKNNEVIADSDSDSESD